MSLQKRILQLPVGTTPAELDQFLCVQDTAGSPVTRRLSFATLLTLFSTLFKGAWVSSTTYTVGQIVESAGSAYQCIATSLNQAPPNVTYWKLIVSKGATGTAGATWSNGSAAPDNGNGVDGDFYLRTTNDDIYKKAGGVWSIVGNFKGATGDVREWLVGSGAPTSQGENGDLYLDSATGDIYGPKASDTWPGSPAANIKGAQGEPGEPGAPGGSGPTGGTVGQVWFKLSSDDYDGEWRIAAIGDISGLTTALAGKASTAHTATHAPGGSDALPWTTIHGRGTTGAKPTAAAGNAGYLYFDTTLGKLQRSTGSAWEDVSETGGGGTASLLKEAITVATTANITLSGTQTIDGVAVVVGNRVLVKNQTDPANNGIYVVASGSWSRATDATTDLLLNGVAALVLNGTVSAGQIYILNATPAGAFGTWSRYSGGPWTSGGRFRSFSASTTGSVLLAFGGTGPAGASPVALRSSDSGANWTDITPDVSPELLFTTNINNAWMSRDGQRIALPGKAGIAYSSNGGTSFTWKALDATSGLGEGQVYGLSCSDDGATMLVAVLKTGSNLWAIQKSTNTGTSWTETIVFSSGTAVKMVKLTADGTNAVAAYYTTGAETPGGVFISSNGGTSWPTSATVTTADVNDLALSDDGLTVFAGCGSGGVKRSTNGGISWSTVTGPVTGMGVACNGAGTHVVAVDESDDTIWISSNGGSTFTQTTPSYGGSGANPYCAAVSNDGTKAYFGDNSTTEYGCWANTIGTAASYTWTNSNRTQTASRIMATDANGHITTTAAASLAELAFLAGVTSGLQAQLDAKEPIDTILTLTTTNATPTALTTIALANNTARKFTMEVVGRRTDTGSDVAGWDFTGVIKRGANAAATAMQGTAIRDDATGANPAGWDADALADTSGGGLQPKVTGESGATINWKVRVRMTTV